MLDVLIITHNEALNLPHCLKSIRGWVNRIFVVDSGSTDETEQIAREHGAEFIYNPWPGYARQRNWALENLPITSPWVLIVDADESIPAALRERLESIVSQPADSVPENGFFINRLTYFLGKPIRHCGYFPSWNMRLFKRGVAKYEDRRVHEHMIIDDPVGRVQEPMVHHDRRGLEHFYAKHNRYSTLEAEELFLELQSQTPKLDNANLTKDARRRRWLKRRAMRHLPWPGAWRFVYMYFIQLGILDGRVGYRFCCFIANYDAMVAFKLRALISLNGGATPHQGLPNTSTQRAALANPEGERPPASDGPGSRPVAPPTSRDAAELMEQPELQHLPQMQPESSPWSFQGKLARAVWMLTGRPLFRFSFHNWYGYRRMLLRIFGARIGKDVAIRPTAHVEIPWMLQVEDGASIGDDAIIYSLGPVRIGKRAIISQYAHLCAGTHDYADHTFKLIRSPITIGDDCWIGTDAFIGPGVTIGTLTVIGARSSAYKDMPPGKVCVGNPAKPIKDRELK